MTVHDNRSVYRIQVPQPLPTKSPVFFPKSAFISKQFLQRHRNPKHGEAHLAGVGDRVGATRVRVADRLKLHRNSRENKKGLVPATLPRHLSIPLSILLLPLRASR